MKKALALLALVFSVLTNYANTGPTNGNFQIVFAGTNWVFSEPPDQLRKVLEPKNSPLRIIAYAQSLEAGLTMYATRSEFTSGRDPAREMAGFLKGLRDSTASQVNGPMQESTGTLPNSQHPFVQISGIARQGNYFQVHTIMCDRALYGVAVAGDPESKEEAAQILNGISILDKPMTASAFEKGLNFGTVSDESAQMQRIGYLFGRVVGFLIIPAVIVAIIVNRRSDRRPKTSPPPLPKTPPPLPPSV